MHRNIKIEDHELTMILHLMKLCHKKLKPWQKETMETFFNNIFKHEYVNWEDAYYYLGYSVKRIAQSK